jgi:scyllo-inositol 2-dehydrogenase (NADP+)
VRYVVVGLGGIGQKRRAVLGTRCIVTVDPVNRDADYQQLDECPDDSYDAVVLAVPNDVKLDLLERSLRAGKHVLLEKPLIFPDRAAAERFQALADNAHAVWYTSYNHRFEPLIVRLKHRYQAGEVGRLYYARLFYGNGTVGNIIGTWREHGLGVVEDLGSHLLDLAAFLCPSDMPSFVCTAERHAARVFDHAVLTSLDRRLWLEASFLSWRNTFSIDLFGDRGSLHLSGLAKWGPTELVCRERVLPSGVPRETRETFAGSDPTWVADIQHFENLVERGATSMEHDWWISRNLHVVAA